MKSHEPFVHINSDYYSHSPSVVAQKMFFYPICVGDFIYEPGYYLSRDHYDSFLVEIIKSGTLMLEIDGKAYPVREGQVVLLDCYKPHKYYSSTGWEALWVHFDGITARNYYNQIVATSGNVIDLRETFHVTRNLDRIYQLFHSRKSPSEALISQYITAVLTDLLVYLPEEHQQQSHSQVVDEIVIYINDHLDQDLSVEKLAQLSALSPYHFIRVFKRETGYTPHEYVVQARMNLAKYLLKTTQMSVKEIGITTGYSAESIFSSAFKRYTGVSPTIYRTGIGKK